MAKGYTESPYNLFGAKGAISKTAWERFGHVDSYCEPFFGSGAVMLGCPYIPEQETVNDLSGMIVNMWRSIKYNPLETANYALNPIFELDLHARHIWLLSQKEKLVQQLEANPSYHNPMIAGWFAWGLNCWIGDGFLSGTGPWSLVDGKLEKTDGKNPGIFKKIPEIRSQHGVNRTSMDIHRWFETLSKRFRNTRVLCGDWTRLKSHVEGAKSESTAVLLDPPYSGFEGLYQEGGDKSISKEVREWALEIGQRKNIRVALCGYEGEHPGMVEAGWEEFSWKSAGGFSLLADNEARDNREKERIFFSPYCHKGKQVSVFDLIKKKKEVQDFQKLKEEIEVQNVQDPEVV